MASKEDREAPSARDVARAARPKLADVVSEGVYIAAAATRLALKNRILVEILAQGEGFDADRFLVDAKETLLTLAAEAEEDAERTERERRRARRRHNMSGGTHDYRARDVRNLRRRRRQSEKVAKELRARAEDPEALRQLVQAAREAAWDEVARNIDSTLRIEAARPDLEPDYQQMREARMQSVMLVDLARLAAHRRRLEESVGGAAEDAADSEEDAADEQV